MRACNTICESAGGVYEVIGTHLISYGSSEGAELLLQPHDGKFTPSAMMASTIRRWVNSYNKDVVIFKPRLGYKRIRYIGVSGDKSVACPGPEDKEGRLMLEYVYDEGVVYVHHAIELSNCLKRMLGGLACIARKRHMAIGDQITGRQLTFNDIVERELEKAEFVLWYHEAE